ncbi:glycosyltransferase [Candidatus Microgenomates bacterium]|nr:glycosyltransferase [Candidatus Microgenomates bacterium]
MTVARYKLQLSLIIPAYNEEKKIEADIRRAKRYFKKARIKSEIIVSTDGITDRTNIIVKHLQKKYKNLKLIAQKNKIGKGAAIKAGVFVAGGKYVMFADAGYCVPFKYIRSGIALLEKGNDCAFGSRALAKSKIIKKQPLYRIIGSRVFGIIVRNVIKIPKTIEDTQCGFKLYKKNVAKKLFKELKTKQMMFDIELILRTLKHKYKIGIFPVVWKSDLDTKFNPVSGSWENIKDLLKIKLVYRL